eukprot:TRINITY_DN11639_c0_g1_i1.p1 TRINITY_DN11639_c0_g1~~TRINITY_DN11639_c0_g1_i1.p1  ORF type:complete len:427 (-),score=88.81 TRINITY_DN11639_c0_g1_i1:199-1437(-)
MSEAPSFSSPSSSSSQETTTSSQVTSGTESSVSTASLPTLLTQPVSDNSSLYIQTQTPNATDTKQATDQAKLFVGQVPKTVEEKDLRKYFEPYGEVKDVAIVRDKQTQVHKGCAFIVFAKKADAEKAIQGVNEKITLGTRPLQVRFAISSQEDREKNKEWKLFVGMLARTTTEDQVRQLFSGYGTVREIYLMKDTTGTSRGCAFVKMSTREEGQAAILALNEVYQDQTSPRKLIVRWAETGKSQQKQQQQQLQQQQATTMLAMNQSFLNPFLSLYGMNSTSALNMGVLPSLYSQTTGMFPSLATQASPSMASSTRDVKGPPGANLFIYNVPETFGDNDLSSMFAPFGAIVSARIFRDKNTQISKGFGFVSYSDTNSAERAIQALNGCMVGGKRLKVEHKKGDGSSGVKFSPY